MIGVAAPVATPPRRTYLDWLRGAAVLIMIEGHAFDAWTAVGERTGPVWGNAMILAGFAAPIFLFLSGLSLMLAIGARQSKGASDADAAAAALGRGCQIFGLAFLFRLQSWLLGGGAAPLSSMLKVDILNIMGLSMVVTACLWSIGRDRRTRAVLLLSGAVAVAMVTPLARSTPLLSGLPDPLESYLRPLYGRGTFAVFPWAGFVLAGAAVGLALEATRTVSAERRTIGRLAAAGGLLAGAGYGASFLPSIYPDTNFWTTSPTFFFLRLGLLVTFVGAAYAWNRRTRVSPANGWSPLVDLGRASLFVYWIHVELAYSGASKFLHKQLSLERVLVAYAVFVGLMLGLTWLKREFSKPLMTRRLLSRG